MPMVRYQIRNEYGLSDPELYGAAEKDDPEALLEGVAMAGLVGLLRQLGDLAEFAAEIFHDLHEEVMVTASRGHGLTLRLHQLEAEFPSVEKALISQISLPNVVQNDGVEWHFNSQTDRNLITSGDMPRFVMDSYEECRGPPHLFTLDKFDVAGAGACLKRYSDPSFFKTETASCGLIETEDAPREKKPRKIKKKALRVKKGETLESLMISSSESQPSTENQASIKAPIERRVKLKSRKLHNSDNNSREIHHAHLIGLIESQQKILLANSEKQSCFKRDQNCIMTKPVKFENDASSYVQLDREPGEMQKMRKIFPIQEQNDSLSSELDKIEIGNEIGSLNQAKEKILGDSDEQENFVDALNTSELETETESEEKPKLDLINMNNNEGLRSSSQKEIINAEKGLDLESNVTVTNAENEFDEANEEFFDNDDLMDVSSTSSLHSDGARQLDGLSVSDHNNLIALPKTELSAEQTQENLEDLRSLTEQNNSSSTNHVEEPIQDDTFEALEMPSAVLQSGEIKISDEAWIVEDSLVSNEETKSTNESINETCNGEDSSVSNKEGKCILENLVSTEIEDPNYNAKFEGTLQGQSITEDSLISNEKSRNDINETFNVEDSSISNKEGKLILDDIKSIGLEDPNGSASKLDEKPENHNEVSQVELKNISDEILNLEEYLVFNRESDNTARNISINGQKDSYPLNEKDESLPETGYHSEEAQDDSTDKFKYAFETLQSNQKYISDEILNHEDLISFGEEENVPTVSIKETMNLPKHLDGLKFEENADCSAGEKDEKILEETLIQPNENTLFQEPKDFSNERIFEEILIQPNENTLFQEPKDISKEPLSPKSQMGDFIQLEGGLLDLYESKEEENSFQNLDSCETQPQLDKLKELKDWQEYLVEETIVDSIKQNQEDESKSTQYNFENNCNLLDTVFLNHDDSLERYAENPFETNIHVERDDNNVENLIIWSDNEEYGDFNAEAKGEFPTPTDFLWEPASPPCEEVFRSESTNEPLVTSLGQNDAFIEMDGAPGPLTTSMHQDHELAEQNLEPEPYRFYDASKASELHISNNSACAVPEELVSVKDEFGDSGLPAPSVDQVHKILPNDSETKAYEVSDESKPEKEEYVDSGLPSRIVDHVHDLSGLSDPPVDHVHEQSQLDDLKSKSNEPLSEEGFNHEQSEFSSETNINQSYTNNPFCAVDPLLRESDELSLDKTVPDIGTVVPSILLNVDNKQSEENADLNSRDFSHNSCTNESGTLDQNNTVSIESMSDKEIHVSTKGSIKDLSIEENINETEEGPFTNAFSTAFTDLLDAKPNPKPSIDTNANDLDMSDVFSLVSHNSNLSLQDKPPPLPPLGWRMGGKLRKGSSLPSNGSIAISTRDPFEEMPSIIEPRQADTARSDSQGAAGEKSNLADPVKLINTPDPFVEMLSVEIRSESISTTGSQKECEKPNTNLFVEMPNIDAANLTVEMPSGGTSPHSQTEGCPGDLKKLEGENEKPLAVSLFNLPPISNPNPPPNPFLGQNVQNFECKGLSPDLSTNLFLPVQIHQPGYLISLEENLWAQYGIGPSIEDKRLGRKPYSIRNIPRNPLMDAVAAHDRSTMRKVSELAKPTEKAKSDERNSLLEQIRNKSFSLRPVGAPKTTAVKAPQTNLKVAAIVEKANAIRHACAGSDEEQDEDSWSDA